MTPTRNPRAIGHGLVLLAAAVGLVWLGATRGGWWEACWLAALCSALAGAGDVADGATRRARDNDKPATDAKDTP